MQKFGERLRNLREAKQITTWAVEKRTGVSRANLSSIEKGRRPASDDVLQKLASIEELGVTYEQLLAWKRLDGATLEEKKAIAREFLASATKEEIEFLKQELEKM